MSLGPSDRGVGGGGEIRSHVDQLLHVLLTHDDMDNEAA